MAEPRRSVSEYARLSLIGTESSIIRSAVAAGNFEIKPSIIQMVHQVVQFHGLQDEDPYAHIANFLEICGTFKINGATDDAVRLRLFPFSLRNRAKQWLNSRPGGSITTWDQMVEIFLEKYFPLEKIVKTRSNIFSYAQIESETLYDTWERFNDLLRRCPPHQLPTWQQVQIFYDGLDPSIKQMIDVAARGNLNSKTPEAAQELIEKMAINSYFRDSTQAKPTKLAGVYDVDAITTLAAQVEALSKKIDGLSVEQQPTQNNSYMYNPGWKNHPNFSWENQG